MSQKIHFVAIPKKAFMQADLRLSPVVDPQVYPQILWINYRPGSYDIGIDGKRCSSLSVG
jgi:hypothetical protein